MKLRDEYKNIDIEKTIKDNLEKNVKTGVTEITVILDKINIAMETIRRNNWEEIYIALKLLLEKSQQENLKLQLSGVRDGILFYPSSIILDSLILGRDKTIPCVVKMTEDIDINCIVIDVEKENFKKVKSILNNICIEWADIFIINNI